jgi:hypothetical protein
MSDWKVLVVVAFAVICLGLVIATIVVPLALTPEDNKWAWFGGLLFATIGMGTLFTLFLRSADSPSAQNNSRKNR